MSSTSNRRIAKNTLFLYVRMIAIMLVTLYTARVVLATLGEDDYGIYNVIGGVVVLFSFLNTAMNNATQRFLSFEIGRKDNEQLKRTFCMSINCHALLAAVIFVLAETIGLWFVWSQLNIPIERHNAAIWVYQFTILTFVLSILRVPYNASIIAHERMSFYAYISIVEVLLNLGIVFLLINATIDKLILYAALKFLVTLVFWILFYAFCKKSFSSCSYNFFWDNSLLKKLLSFSSWSMICGGSVLVSQNGNNILLNIFSGIAVNAAYGIANQVSAAIYGFVSNFQMAFQPQIVKLYAEKKIEEQHLLINRASFFSFYLLLIISLPFIINADFVLTSWLSNVPNYAVEFCQWMLIYSLIDAIQAPLWMAINATGNIKVYSIWSSSLNILSLPATWVILTFGYSPIWVFIVRVIINFVTAIVRVVYVKSFIDFPSLTYIKCFFRKAFPVTVLSFVIAFYINSNFNHSFVSFIMVTGLTVFCTGILIYLLGLDKTERTFVVKIINDKLRK